MTDLEEQAKANRLLSEFEDEILDTCEAAGIRLGLAPHQVLAGIVAVSVRLAWAGAKDRARIPSVLAQMTDDYLKQAARWPE